MITEAQFNFLRVKKGILYFARVAVAVLAGAKGVRLSANAGAEGPHTPESWLKAAKDGVERALKKHLELGGTRVGLVINLVLGTGADTTDNSVEVAAFCAAWKVLGREESHLKFEFDGEWTVILPPPEPQCRQS